MDEVILADVFMALETVVVERLDDGCFQIIGSTPDWFRLIFQEADSGEKKLTLNNNSHFLENFMVDAENFWLEKGAGQLRSGPWTESDPSGNNITLEAAAISAGKRNILLIEQGRYAQDEKRYLIQKGRELRLDHRRLEQVVAERTAKLLNTMKKHQKALDGIIQAVALTIESRDPYTAGHQKRVSKLVCGISEELSLSEREIEGFRLAAIIHDLGKISSPADLLSKPGKLTENEFNLIKDHPQVGYDILKDMEFPWPIAQLILQHHERLDGSGYPLGLSGQDILLGARIIAVADVVEAMSSQRPYRLPLGIKKALKEITDNREVLYDGEVVDACLKLFKEKGFEFE